MCFSAGASFTAAGALSIMGLLALRQVRKKSQALFALMPLLFSVQQLSEGFIWINIQSGGNEFLRKILSLSFIGFAELVWPIFMPLSLLYMENDYQRRRSLRVLLFFGIFLGVYMFMLSFSAKAHVVGHHIQYGNGMDFLEYAIYCIPVVLPFFIVDNWILRLIGICSLVSLVLSYIFAQACAASVWCFFAAGISSMVVWFLYSINNNGRDNK